jgi:hypothetical protein
MNTSDGTTGRQRSGKTERKKLADEEREKEMRPPEATRITIQEKLDSNDICIIWDDQEEHVPESVIYLRQKLLDFSGLIPMEFVRRSPVIQSHIITVVDQERRFRKYMDKDRDQFIDRGYYEDSKKDRAQAALDIGKASEYLKRTGSRESQWIKRIAEGLVFKGLEFDTLE